MKREDGGLEESYNNEIGGEMRQDVMLSAIKGEFTGGFNQDLDLRKMADHEGDFLKDISGFGLTSPIQPPHDQMRGAGPVNAYEQNINLTMELQRIVNEQLKMEEVPMMLPEAEFNITANDDVPMADFFGEGIQDDVPMFGLDKNDLGLEGLQSLLGQKGKAAHKKQVYQIRDAMMKFDKKTQRV
jgi:hypothetical protein